MILILGSLKLMAALTIQVVQAQEGDQPAPPPRGQFPDEQNLSESKNSRQRLSPLYFPVGKNIREKSYRFDVETRYFSKTATFDQDGTIQPMNAGDSFQLMDGEATLFYGYSEVIQLAGFVNMRQLSSQSSAGELTNSGVESYGGSIKYAFPGVSDLSLAFEAKYRLTAYSNTLVAPGTATSGDIELGDGGSTMTFLGHTSYRLSPTHYLSASLGYQIPPSHLSQELIYSIHSSWNYLRMGFELGANGIYSLGTDSFTSARAERPVMNTGTSAQFNSLNRSYITPYAGAALAFESFTLRGEFGKRMMGVSTDEGIEMKALLTWTGGGTDPRRGKIDSFKEYLIEASVIKVSPRGKFVKIDKGVTSDVEKGMEFDIYKSDFFGGNKLLFSGLVIDLGSDWAIVQINKIFIEHPLEVGLVARGK